jgi:nitroreductase
MLELLRKRRSIRKYTTDRIAPGQIDVLIEAALRAPSSRGINPWEFVLVTEPELLTRLSTAKQHGSEFLKNAPCAVVVCADSTTSDVWIEDCAIAAIIIQLTAQSLGLGSCWAQIRNRKHDQDTTSEEYVRELLGLPETFAVLAVIGIGHPAETKRPVAAARLQRDKIRHNHWSEEDM